MIGMPARISVDFQGEYKGALGHGDASRIWKWTERTVSRKVYSIRGP